MEQLQIALTEQSKSQRGMRFLISAAALVIIIGGIIQAQSVLALILISGFLAVIGTPPVLWLKRKRIPFALAVVIVIAGFVLILLIAGVLVGISIKSVFNSMPFYQTRLQEQVLALKALLASMGIIVNANAMLGYVNPEALSRLGTGILESMGSVLSNTVLILLTVSFILFEASSFPIKLRAALGEPKAVFPEFAKFVNDIKRYVVIQTVVSLISGILAGVWLAILGADFAILFGLLAFFFSYVPQIGVVIAIIPAAILTFIQFGVGRALLVASFLVITFVIGNVIQPRIMGQKLGLSTLVVFLSLIFWGSLLGLIGMVLCVPFTMALKFVLERSENTRWIAALLGR
jgi:AI-2 transport protein TqsA